MDRKKALVLALLIGSIVAIVAYLAWPEATMAAKPQEPKHPYPYQTEKVTIPNNNGDVALSGTLTLPRQQGPFAAVVLISGSGAQDRNEEVFGHKPFLVIADYLTRQGFAVLRYDDRGVGKSSGDFGQATSADFATDAESAVAYLRSRKDIAPDKVGLAGHSEGGVVAAIAASRSKDVAFVMSLAGPGVLGIDVITLQSELIARAGGVDEAGIAFIRKANNDIKEILRSTPDTAVLRTRLTAYTKTNLQDYPSQMLPPGIAKEDFFKHQVQAMCSPWYQYAYQMEPASFFAKVSCPVLALNGGKDLQVDARQNLPEIAKAVRAGGNANVTTRELPGLNHLFQACDTGHPNEYAGIEETFSPDALHLMGEWLKKQTR